MTPGSSAPRSSARSSRCCRASAGVAVCAAEGSRSRPPTQTWSLALEDDYGRRRDEFVARVGDYNAPLSADHVYMYLHQTRWNEDNDTELAWHREREIAKIEEMWEAGDAREGEP